MSSVECGGGSEAVRKKIGTKCFPVVLGGWFVLWRPKSQQIPVHSYPTNPKGCSTAVPGHPCSVTCPQPAQEKDLGEETAANPWFGCVTQVAQHRRGICSGSSSPHAPRGTSCVILPRQTFHCSVSPFSPRETGRKFHPFAPLLKTSWN